MTTAARYLIASGLVIFALLSLLPNHHETRLHAGLAASSVPSRDNLAVEATAPPHTEAPRASRSATTSHRTNAPAPKARTAPTVTVAQPAEIDGMPALLRRIGGCESSGDPEGPLVWTAQNPHSSASGAFEEVDGTWRSWARAYGTDVGAPAYARAYLAPPSVQLTVAERAFAAQGSTPWNESRSCWA
jgi:hypothetical protein